MILSPEPSAIRWSNFGSLEEPNSAEVTGTASRLRWHHSACSAVVAAYALRTAGEPATAPGAVAGSSTETACRKILILNRQLLATDTQAMQYAADSPCGLFGIIDSAYPVV
ncbi:hypothetical protein HG15A2_24690 [Adhaeretor mobilis]|uniref:Uncharacterized protein n=1 Tax=Adhaeretor mobilis TaxID=1930276 RepID=A0A517MWJ6_9BACT|nr:hypothetical protein HG15A2_24690 [Adhaeretor mobilis]